MAKESQFTEEDKYKAACLYYLYHNFRQVERETGIAWSTVRYWSQQGWWLDMMENIVKENRAKIRSRGNELIDLSMEAVKDRLKNGDYVFDKRNQLTRKPVALRDALLASLSWMDKVTRIDASDGFAKESPTMLKDIARDLQAIGKKIGGAIPPEQTKELNEVSEYLKDLPTGDDATSGNGTESRPGTA